MNTSDHTYECNRAICGAPGGQLYRPGMTRKPYRVKGPQVDMLHRPDPDASDLYRVEGPTWDQTPERKVMVEELLQRMREKMQEPLEGRVRKFVKDCRERGESVDEVRRIFDEVLAQEVLDA